MAFDHTAFPSEFIVPLPIDTHVPGFPLDLTLPLSMILSFVQMPDKMTPMLLVQLVHPCSLL